MGPFGHGNLSGDLAYPGDDGLQSVMAGRTTTMSAGSTTG